MKKQPDAMAGLQAATDALQGRTQHFAHMGGAQQQNAHDLIRRAKILLAPEPALELANAMNQISDEVDRIVGIHRQRAVDNDAARDEQLALAQAMKDEHLRRQEENRLRRIAMVAQGGY